MSRIGRSLLLIVVGALLLAAPLNATAAGNSKSAVAACKAQRKSLGNHKFVAKHLGASAARTKKKTRRNVQRALKKCVAKKSQKSQVTTQSTASTPATDSTSASQPASQAAAEAPATTPSADTSSAATDSSATAAQPERAREPRALVAPHDYLSSYPTVEAESGLSPYTITPGAPYEVSPAPSSYSSGSRITITPAHPWAP